MGSDTDQDAIDDRLKIKIKVPSERLLYVFCNTVVPLCANF